MVAISRQRLLLISKTTKGPTTSEFLQLLRTSVKFFQSAFLAVLYQAFRAAPHSLCAEVASRIAFWLTIRAGKLEPGRYKGESTPAAKKGTACRAPAQRVLLFWGIG